WKLKHVDEAAFRAVAEEVSGRDLSTFFAQWLHTTELYDYAVGRVKVGRAAVRDSAGQKLREAGPWITRVEVLRKAPGRIPVEVAVVAEHDTAVVRAEGLADREWVRVETRSRPKQVMVDPGMRTHDWNMLDNRKRVGGLLSSLRPPPGTEFYLHPYFSTRSRRDHMTIGIHPTVWYNDAGGVTLGLRSQNDYLGRFEQNQALFSAGTGWATDEDVKDFDFFLRVRNPVLLRRPNVSQTFDAFKFEGRYGAAATVEWSRRAHLSYGPVRTHRAIFQWVAVDNVRYLDPELYDNVGTVELRLESGITNAPGKWKLSLLSSLGGGLNYNRDGLAASGRPDLDPFYFRGFLEGIARRKLGSSTELGMRGYLAAGLGGDDAAKQRQIYFQGADPLAQLNNPFLRSRGALLVRDDFHYHAAGGAGVRGVDPHVSTGALAALNLELEQVLVTRPSSLFRELSLAAFTDLSHGLGGNAQPLTGERVRFLGDAGLGVRIRHKIGDTEFVTRFDIPLYVSEPALAQDRNGNDGEFAFRWTFSFQDAF
ncbi:MAG TPA: hypothetical protein VIM84_08330, partial [Gemmatimonadales bacterium]